MCKNESEVCTCSKEAAPCLSCDTYDEVNDRCRAEEPDKDKEE